MPNKSILKAKRTKSIFIAFSIIIICLIVTLSYFFYFSKKEMSYDSFQLQTEIPTSKMDNIHLKLNSGEELSLLNLRNKITDTSVLQTFFSKFVDIDSDGVRELVVSYNNGGAAGIQTTSFFLSDSSRFLKQGFIYDGDVTFSNGKIDFHYNNWTKYFHACGTCTIWLPSELPTTFSLDYKSNNLYYRSDNSLNDKIYKNLSYLKRKGDFTSDSYGVDNGTRKAYFENLIEFFFNNNGDLKSTQNVFYEYYADSDSNQIWEEIKKQIVDLKSNFNIQVYESVKKDKNLVFSNNPKEIYTAFKTCLKNSDFESAQQFIHSNGVYFFGNGRIFKNEFNQNKINSLSGGFELHMVDPGQEIPKDNTSGKQMIEYIIKDGKIEINDNYNNAAGFDVVMESPHFSEDWRKDGGYFKKGSMIISVNPNPDENQERLLIEMYPDNGQWRIYSIGKWYWTP